MSKSKKLLIILVIVIIAIILGIYLIINNNDYSIVHNDKYDYENQVIVINKDYLDNADVDENFLNELKNQEINDELKIGIIKYLEFLQMIDGAFNDQRYNNESFVVNGVKLKNTTFECEYRDNKETCYGKNFEDNLKKLFSKNIDINRIYGDGVAIKWYEKREDGYVFTNLNNCDVGRMDINHYLVLKEKTDDKLVFKVQFKDKIEEGSFKGEHVFKEDFILIKEDGDWKVARGFYHNPCYMEYIVE